MEGEPDSEPEVEELRILLFESVRELLFNVVKHAKANEARVTITRLGDEEVQIEVADRGVGFKPDKSENGSGGRGCGLASMRERLLWIGALWRSTRRLAKVRDPAGRSPPVAAGPRGLDGPADSQRSASEPGAPDQEVFKRGKP